MGDRSESRSTASVWCCTATAAISLRSGSIALTWVHRCRTVGSTAAVSYALGTVHDSNVNRAPYWRDPPPHRCPVTRPGYVTELWRCGHNERLRRAVRSPQHIARDVQENHRDA